MKYRSILAIPAGQLPSQDDLASPADVLLFTLADDRVAIDAARSAAQEGVRAAGAAGKGVLVRVNHPLTGLLEGDLESVVEHPLSGVLLSTSANPQDVRDTAVALRRVELERGLEPGHAALFPVVDTARGLLRAVELVTAAPRVAGLVFDSDAYAFDVGGRPEENGPRFAYARGLVVAASRGHDREPLVVSSGLELRFLAQHGFAGAIVDDLRYVTVANSVFTPGASALKRARRHVDAYTGGRGEGAFAARAETELADGHSLRKARRWIEISES